MRLTRGEGWWLMRRREGLTQVNFARAMGWSVDRCRAIERDRARAPMPARCGTMRPDRRLTPGEFATICRRRAGEPVEAVAFALAVSPTTIKRMERDRTRTAGRLAAFWLGEPLPRALAAVPVRVGSPSKTACRSREDRGGRAPTARR